MSKRHNIVLRLVSKKGMRKEYQVLLNDVVLYGKVVETYSKGTKIWQTIWKDQVIDHYNPEWLARRNNRTITLDTNHPSMYQVKRPA
jgi:hypothetical protein